MKTLHSNPLIIYVTLYDTYWLLYYKWYSQIISNQSIFLNWQEKGNWENKMQKNCIQLHLEFVTLYDTYLLLYCEWHIQIISS